MEEFDRPPQVELPAQVVKGRGAIGNVDHRFTTESRQAEDDGWWRDDEAAPGTELLVDAAKSIITLNDSPDIPFTQAINPYRGCEHGCIYCYARPTHAYLGMSPGLDFETRILHKPDAPKRLCNELARPDYVCAPIVLGSATDAYQPFERKLGLTRSLLEILLACRHPVSVVTKSTLVTRDIDLWEQLARQQLGQVAISLTTLDPDLARRLEPRASSPAARLDAIARLSAAGIPVAVIVAPLIPGLNDHQLEKLLAAAREKGAVSASYTILRLPYEVAGLFEDWLAQHAPQKAAHIMAILYNLRSGKVNDAQFGSRMTGLGHYASLFRQRFDLACRRLGLAEEVAPLDCTRFEPPARYNPAHEGQLRLF